MSSLKTRRAELELRLAAVGTERTALNGWKFYDLPEPGHVLESLLLNGFVFHGTSRRIDGELVPQKANDLAKESGNREAVYLTPNPDVAMFASFSGGRDVRGRQHVSHLDVDEATGKIDRTGEQKFSVGDTEALAAEGFIYIFDRSQADEDVSGELLAYEKIKPLAIARVHREKFPYPIDEIDAVEPADTEPSLN